MFKRREVLPFRERLANCGAKARASFFLGLFMFPKNITGNAQREDGKGKHILNMIRLVVLSTEPKHKAKANLLSQITLLSITV